MSSILARLDRVLSMIENTAIAGLTLAALTIGTMQVVLRYSFNTGYPWSEAAFTLCTITAMLFAGSRAVRDDKHVRVELVSMLASSSVRRGIRFAGDGAALALSAYFVYCGVLYVIFAHMIETASPDTGIPDWITYSLVPLSMGLFALRYVIRLTREVRRETVPVVPGGSPEVLAQEGKP